MIVFRVLLVLLLSLLVSISILGHCDLADAEMLALAVALDLLLAVLGSLKPQSFF